MVWDVVKVTWAMGDLVFIVAVVEEVGFDDVVSLVKVNLACIFLLGKIKVCQIVEGWSLVMLGVEDEGEAATIEH